MSLSKKNIKLLQSLRRKKDRQKLGLFVVEGKKSVKEFMESKRFQLHEIFVTSDLMENYPNAIEISLQDLKKVSSLVNPDDCIAVFEIPTSPVAEGKELTLALDRITDPGNLGTIIRLADWFGVKQIWCSHGTVDLYNPKVIQATMGSLTRVEVVYLDLEHTIQNSNLPVIATAMDGESVYKTSLPSKSIIVLGNEANGISSEIFDRADHKISIPSFNNHKKTESLNVAMAGGILLSEFRRRS